MCQETADLAEGERDEAATRSLGRWHATVTGLAETMSAQLAPAMLTESPDPLATVAWRLR